jgi:hypothetical protein
MCALLPTISYRIAGVEIDTCSSLSGGACVQQEVMCLKLRAHAVDCPSVYRRRDNSSLSIKLLTNILTL